MWFLLVAVISVPEMVFVGNWSVKSFGNVTDFENSPADFRIQVYPRGRHSNFNFISCKPKFDPTSQFRLDTDFDFTGVISDDPSAIFCFRSLTSFNKSTRFFLDVTAQYKIQNLTRIDLLSTVFMHELRLASPTDGQIVFGFHLSPKNLSKGSIFHLPTVLNGSCSINHVLTLALEGTRFDLDSFLIEGKLFGLGLSVCIVCSFYAWAFLLAHYETSAQLKSLSVHSFMLHIGFDFALGFVLLDISTFTERFGLLFTFLFICVFVIYFLLQIQVLIVIWTAHLAELEDANSRWHFLRYFLEVTLIVSGCSFASNAAFDCPLPCLIVLYSFWIPQISHSLRDPSPHPKLAVFAVLLTASRSFPLLYFSLYERNIMSSRGCKVGILFGAYIALQFAAVFCQSVFGGNHCLPRRFRDHGFDYAAATPEEGALCPICMTEIDGDEVDVMTPPCGHSFHMACLTRWMEEARICPVCRGDLPTLAEREA
jgi:hypothetical protein